MAYQKLIGSFMNKFSNADEAVLWMEKRTKSKHDIAHFKTYLKSINNPQYQLHCIHIAGTNGKGSTTSFITSILEAAQYTVGTFTSPYLISHYDRICIHQVPIETTVFLNIVNEYYEQWIQWDLSMFEIDLCIAIQYFILKKVDICVIETGIGGRLDATNVFHSLLSVITNIGMDHMQILGNTLQAIAYQKVGILNENGILFTSEHKKECLDVFQKEVEQKHGQMIVTDVCENIHGGFTQSIIFDYQNMKDIVLSFHAQYQCDNAALAIEVITYMQKIGYQIDQDQIYKGLKKAVWNGRFEIIRQDPLVILDGAHNIDGVHALVKSLNNSKQKWNILYGALMDKQYLEMYQALTPIANKIIICEVQNTRHMDIEAFQHFDQAEISSDAYASLATLWSKKEPLLICGSLYFISDMRKFIFSSFVKE